MDRAFADAASAVVFHPLANLAGRRQFVHPCSPSLHQTSCCRDRRPQRHGTPQRRTLQSLALFAKTLLRIHFTQPVARSTEISIACCRATGRRSRSARASSSLSSQARSLRLAQLQRRPPECRKLKATGCPAQGSPCRRCPSALLAPAFGLITSHSAKCLHAGDRA